MKEEASGKAIGSLVFGILGITGYAPCIGSILAIVLGWGERSGIGRAGLYLGWIGLGLQLAVGVLALLVLFFAGMIEFLN